MSRSRWSLFAAKSFSDWLTVALYVKGWGLGVRNMRCNDMGTYTCNLICIEYTCTCSWVVHGYFDAAKRSYRSVEAQLKWK
jgi:hypothetical protein